MPTVVTAEKLWTGVHLLDHPILTVEDGRILSISTRAAAETPASPNTIDFPAATVAPSFFDVHLHGAAGHDVMEATPAALDSIGHFLAAHGTGAYLATTVTAPVEDTLRALSGLAELINHTADNAPITRPIGIHLEGPFLSHLKRGVHPPEHLQPADIALFDRFYDAADGHVRLMTLAPELPGAPALAAHATQRGVRVSVGHSNATAAETRAVIAAGAVSATHTFNAMRSLDHREPGILGVALAEDSIYAELICDGIHTTPEMVNIWSRCKGPHRAILVTDAMSATGMPDGEYRLGGLTVTVANGRATAGDVLAGSVLTLDRALANFLRFTGSSLEHGLRLLTTNPAAMIGLADLPDSPGPAALPALPGLTVSAGHLAPGLSANFVALNPDGTLAASFLNGQPVP
jgi:N-acetylglucosamine-6-phosphate deacetylase